MPSPEPLTGPVRDAFDRATAELEAELLGSRDPVALGEIAAKRHELIQDLSLTAEDRGWLEAALRREQELLVVASNLRDDLAARLRSMPEGRNKEPPERVARLYDESL